MKPFVYFSLAVTVWFFTACTELFVDKPPPGPPDSIIAHFDGAQVTVSWQPGADASSYQVHRKSGSANYNTIGTAKNTSYIDRAIAEGTYYYKVRSVNDSGESDLSSDYASVRVGTSAPYYVSASVEGTQVTVSWDAVAGAGSYQIYRSPSASAAYTQIGTATAAPYRDSGLSLGTYYYGVKAVSPIGISSMTMSSPVSIEGPPGPSVVSASLSAAGAITVSWDTVAGAGSYQIYRSSSASGAYTEIGTAAASPYIDAGLSVGTYYYGVKAVNQLGAGAMSMSSPVTIEGPPPPGAVSVSLSAADRLTVSWEAVSSVSSYQIYRSTDASGDYTKVGTATASPYTDSGLSLGLTYYYKLCSVNSQGAGSLSSAASVSLMPPSVPGNVSARLEADHVTVSWEAVSDATSYRVYRSTNPSSGYNLKATIEGTSHQDAATGLVVDTPYYYQVRAVNRFGESDPSSAASITLTLPAVPSGLSITALSNTSVRIAWQAVSDAASYRVYQSTGSSGPYTSIETGTPAYTVTGLSPNSTYYFKVASINRQGEGSASVAEPARTASTMSPLVVSQWHNDSLETGEVHLYYFEARSGTRYVLSWNDHTQDSAKTATIAVRVFYQESGTVITLNQHTFTAQTAGKVIIQVTGSSGGTYNVAYGEN